MDIAWHITADDKACVEAILDKQRNAPLVLDRKKWNLAETKPHVERENFWQQMVCMRLSTRARSSPNSKLDRFEGVSPFPLAYDTMSGQQSREVFIHDTLRTHQVGTDRTKISRELGNNFARLEDREWPRVLELCNRLTIRLEPRETEAELADYINDTFEGFGPKQARNLPQALGLTRFEIPIDIRVTKWLNDEFQFPFKVTSTALSDRHYYKLILDAVCKLCAECDTYPCLLDAAIFSAQDQDA